MIILFLLACDDNEQNNNDNDNGNDSDNDNNNNIDDKKVVMKRMITMMS